MVFGRRAEMGIGTLIIFIAMILVAAIAAGVLIQTATSLQNKALLTGERSKGQISTSIRPMTMYAEDGTTDASVQTFYVDLKLAPGSDPIRLEEMLVEFSLKDTASDLEYTPDAAGCTAPNSTHFGVEYLIRGVNYASGYLQRGDVIKMCFNSSRPVTEDETISLLLVPKIGSPTPIVTAMPDIITEQRISVFP